MSKPRRIVVIGGTACGPKSAARARRCDPSVKITLIEQGENLKYIQTQLGHSSPTVTLNVYAHLMKPTNQEAACRLENMVFGGNGSKMVANKREEGN